MNDERQTRGYEQLRKGRFSQPGSSYFLTLCTRDRVTGLAVSHIFQALLTHCEYLHNKDVLELRVMTLMPDHVHMIIRQGGEDGLSAAVRLLKGRSSVDLRQQNLCWQQAGYFEHRLRPDESLASVFRYIFMNPYRKGLVKAGETWPFFYCCAGDWEWFQRQAEHELPLPEWLEKVNNHSLCANTFIEG